MKVCPQCDEQYPEDVEYCAKDGAKLRRASEDDDDPMIGRVLDGRFRIEERFSEGGMGAIYLARQETVGRQVAIKTLRTALADSQEFTDRFMREARVTSRISHPNCVTIHDFGQTDDTLLYLVMEYLEGETLADRLDREGMSVDEAMQVAIQVANALEAAHKEDVVHRDLKPDNIFLLDAAGERIFVKVLDFGISKVVDDNDENLTKTGQVFGTPEYMSPEQGRSKPLDGRSDLYSLGCILYEILSGQPPFRADTPMAVLVSHIQDEPRPLDEIADVPDELAALVEDLLQKDVEDRPESAAVVRRRLEAIQSGDTGKVRAATVAGGDSVESERPREVSDSNEASGGSEPAADASSGEGPSPIDSKWGKQADKEYESSGMSLWLAGALFVSFAVVLVGGAAVVGWYAYEEIGNGAVAEADTGTSSSESAADDEVDQETTGGAAGGEEAPESWSELKKQLMGEQDAKTTSGSPDAGGSGAVVERDKDTGRQEQGAGGKKKLAAAGGTETSDDQTGARPGNENNSSSNGDSSESQKTSGDDESKDGETVLGNIETEDGEPKVVDEEPAEKVDSPSNDNDVTQKTSGSDGDSIEDDETTEPPKTAPSTDEPASSEDEQQDKNEKQNKDAETPDRPSAGAYVSSIQPSASGPYCRAASIRRKLDGAKSAIGECSRSEGGVSARMVFQFMVTSSGDVIRMENFSSDMNQAVASCILDEVKNLPFGRQSGGNCTVRVTLQLSPP